MNVKKLFGAESIYGMYLGDIDERSKIISPFRADDTDPSFAFFRLDGDLLWKDFGGSGKTCGDCVSFVSILFGVSRREAEDKIYKDFIENKGQVPKLKTSRKSNKKGASYGPLRDFELDYWNQFYLSKEDLYRFNIYSNRGFWSGDRCLVYSTPETPSYLYIFGPDSYKAYTPDSEIKFFSHNIADVLEGMLQLEGGGHDWELWIASGRKDALVLWKMGRIWGRKMCVLNPTTERSKTALYRALKYLKQRFPIRYSLMDFDATGWKAMDEWKEHFNPVRLEPSNNGVKIKDIAEVAKYQGIYYLYNKIRNNE